jgi:serine protease Do
VTDAQLQVHGNSCRSLPILVILTVLIAGATVAAPQQTGNSQTLKSASIPDNQIAVLCSLEDSFSAIAQRVEPGVVSITSVQHVTTQTIPGKNEPQSLNEFLKKLFKGGYDNPFPGATPEWRKTNIANSESVTAEGSGTIVRRQGDKFYVLTNYHVVEDAYRVAVRLADETDLKGIVVGIDPVTDLAVIQISSPALTDRNIVPLGDSNTVKVGAWSLALGSPFGFEHTLTVGVVSAVQRELEDEENNYPELIQTDAAINKGNSGGPLLDVEGRVIGINSAIASPTGGSIGLGFAIPINVAKSILDQLIQQGRVVRGWLGAGIQELTPVLQEYYGVNKGVLIASLDAKGPGSKAGLKSEDIIVAMNGAPVSEVKQLQRVIASLDPGANVMIDVVRDGAKQTIQAQIGLSPSTPKGRPAAPQPSSGAGIKVRTMSGDMADRLGMDGVKGVLVVDVAPGSPAENAGLEEGDVVVAFGHRMMSSDNEFNDMLGGVKPGSIIVLKVLRKGVPRLIGFRME